MAEEPDKPTAELSLDKDQVDALLIILTRAQVQLGHFLKEAMEHKERWKDYLKSEDGMTDEEAGIAVEEQQALDHSLLLTIPGILTELRELYPYLQERTKESQIITPKPTWKRTS